MNGDCKTPQAPLDAWDQLWFQVAGTRCNLTCHHCFVSCSPKNDSFGYLTLEQVRRRLDESVPLGVREYYFTGGEPFLNPAMTEILIETLRYGPATVLTNGTVLKDDWLRQLRDAESTSPYSLEFRVSLDGFSPESNDPIRGEGTFARAMVGVRRLVEFGFLPIITAARTWSDDREREVVDRFVQVLREYGCERPRLKILPRLKFGAEEQRAGGYLPSERVTTEMMDDFDRSQLLCTTGRMVTARGVHVCPLLIELPESLLGQSLTSAAVPFALRHGACFTCYQYGAICSNPSTAVSETGMRAT